MTTSNIFSQLPPMTPINLFRRFTFHPINVSPQSTLPGTPSPILEKVKSTILAQLGPGFAKGKLSSAVQPSGVAKPTTKAVKEMKISKITGVKENTTITTKTELTGSGVQSEVQTSTCAGTKEFVTATTTYTSFNAPKQKMRAKRSTCAAKTSLLVSAAKPQGITKRSPENAAAKLRITSVLISAVLMQVAIAAREISAASTAENMELDRATTPTVIPRTPLTKPQKTMELAGHEGLDSDGDVVMSGGKVSICTKCGAAQDHAPTTGGKSCTDQIGLTTLACFDSTGIDTVMVDARLAPRQRKTFTSGSAPATKSAGSRTPVLDLVMNDAPLKADVKTHHKSPIGRLLMGGLLGQTPHVYKGTPARPLLGCQGTLTDGPQL